MARYYQDCVKDLGGVTRTVRGDGGTVNVNVAAMQCFFSHLRAFSHFSMSYVDVKVSQSRLNEILQNSLRVAHQLTHLDLSGQPIHTLNFLPNFKV